MCLLMLFGSPSSCAVGSVARAGDVAVNRGKLAAHDAEAATAKITGLTLLPCTSQTFVTALVTNLAIAGAETAAFLLLSRFHFLSHIYQPRVKLPPESKRQGHPLPKNPLFVLPAILATDDEDVIR